MKRHLRLAARLYPRAWRERYGDASSAGCHPEVRLAIEHRAGSPLEVLDPATLPEISVFPNRVAIGSAGLPVGLLAGVLVLRRKRAVQAA